MRDFTHADSGQTDGSFSPNGLKQITTTELCKMVGTEGLVLQGCGGNLQEWVDGINELFTDEGILRNGDSFKKVSVFEHEGNMNMLFHMDGVDLDVGRLAIWRLATRETFGGAWLSDYVPNRLGGFLQEPPEQGGMGMHQSY